MRIASSGHQHYKVLGLLDRFVLFLSRKTLESWCLSYLYSVHREWRRPLREQVSPFSASLPTFAFCFPRHHPPNTHTYTPRTHTRALKGRWASAFILDLRDIFRTVGFSALSIPIYFLTSRSIDFSHRVISPPSPFYCCGLIPFCTFILLM